MRITRILCVIHEPRMLDVVPPALNGAGFDTRLATSGASAVACVFQSEYDLIIIQSELPDMAGCEVCRRMKMIPDTANTPIMILSGAGSEMDMLACLARGADGYMKSPFSVRELIARIDALLRRTRRCEKNSEIIRTGPLTIDSGAYIANCNGTELPLTCKEFELLKLLAKNKGLVLSKDFLLNRIWGYGFNGKTRTVDVHIRNLRKKLKGDARMIQTVRGEGYIMKGAVSN